ncbi:dTDP-glucose 4,6-dehydratase (plasmid) [Pseudonocardia sp. EC080610-09]|uniref:dTDP-glucose 4,6-dehydratase n=1 Tax=unclassified Pseudonocardia TaxID=2619320 RepID=UPI0007067D31|nr:MULTISPECIES: dTDP-glucose 4,6-dehydratase [unclassified Pseudonocardia]ALL79477.1 dTDP-glucose 4,6-dehydratase [Pseudonocardia sp. EC080610-09]ALL85570.1 dTDP-glucose 4,6-dehydratase [Pseudonocardia sp. EC080619-01]
MRVLVTGGAGFIGSHYIRSLLLQDSPLQVRVLDALTYAGNQANLDPVASDPRLEFVLGDIRHRDTVRKAMADVDVVVHFAAESHVDRSIAAGDDFVTTNVGGTFTLMQVALEKDVERFVHVSTDEVYGSIDTGTSVETDSLNPNSPYSASKASSDMLARAFHRTYGLPVCITRCSNNYGPYQHPEKVIPRFVTALLEGDYIPLYGDGGNMRDWLHVDDHCAALRLVVEGGCSGEIYNIGGGTSLSNIELTRRLLDVVGMDWSRVRRVPDRPGHDRRYAIDDSKIRTELGYLPRTSLEDGLAATVRWYTDHRNWWAPAAVAPTTLGGK